MKIAIQTVCQLAILISSNPSVLVSAAEITKEELVEKIRLRQETVRSAKFSWNEDCFYAKDCIQSPREVDGKLIIESLPTEDTKFKQWRVFSFDGAKTNHHSSNWVFNGAGVFHEVVRRQTFDGENSLMLDDPTLFRDVPYARFYPKNSPNLELTLLCLAPLLDCYRSLHPDMRTINFASYDFRSTGEKLEDVPCVTLTSGSGRLKEKFWFDSSRDYQIRRTTTDFGTGNEIQRQTDLEYRHDPKIGWILSGWKIQRFERGGTVKSSVAASVTKYEINPQLPESEFTIKFPADAYLDDLRKRE